MDAFVRIGQRFPPTEVAFAYGSGVFEQDTYGSADKPMIDLILGVSHPAKWHAANMRCNRGDYSSLMAALGPQAITWLQESTGAGIYYNTLVPLACSPSEAAIPGGSGVKIKYGVMSLGDMKADLLEWKWLYLAGRLHKPVRWLHGTPAWGGGVPEGSGKVPPAASWEVEQAVGANLRSALAAALLLGPEGGSRSPQQIFEEVAALSYKGDIRMAVGGEHPNKVKNIVRPQLGRFGELYSPVFEVLESKGLVSPGAAEISMAAAHSTNERIEVKPGSSVRSELASFLPKSVVISEAAETGDAKALSDAIANIVSRSSQWQSIKGIITAGLPKSIRYSCAKILKGRKVS